MNYLKTIAGVKNAKDIMLKEQEMHDLTFEALQIVQMIAQNMYEGELSPKMYYAWDAIIQICKSIEASNRDYGK